MYLYFILVLRGRVSLGGPRWRREYKDLNVSVGCLNLVRDWKGWGVLWKWQRTFTYDKRRRISGPPKRILASQLLVSVFWRH
jgi:hypothetical protein